MLRNRQHMGKCICLFPLLALLIFRRTGVSKALLPALLSGGWQDHAPGSRAGRWDRSLCSPHTRDQETAVHRQTAHPTSLTDRAQFCAWCLRVITIKNSSTISSLCLKSSLCLGFVYLPGAVCLQWRGAICGLAASASIKTFTLL